MVELCSAARGFACCHRGFATQRRRSRWLRSDCRYTRPPSGVAGTGRGWLPDEAGHGNHAYTLTGAGALDYFEVASILTAVLGRPVQYLHPGLLDFVRRMRAARQPWGLTLVMAGIYTTARNGLAAVVTDDVARMLGRPPRSFRQFAEDYKGCWL